MTYLDYSVAHSADDSTEAMTIAGFVTDGTDRVAFDLSTHVSSAGATMDFQLTVPTRDDFQLAVQAQITDSQITVNVQARGGHGTVAISGVITNGAGSLPVEVNGKPFATLTVSPNGDPSFTGVDGQALTEEQMAALRSVVLLVGGSFELFGHLSAPVG